MGRRKRGERERGREQKRERGERARERERDLNFPSGRGAVARQGLAEGRDWRAPPAAAAAPARPAELHEAAAGAGRAEGTTSLNPAEPCGGSDGRRDRQVGAGLGPGGRSRGCGHQGPGSRLEASGQRRKLGGAAWGGRLPGTARRRRAGCAAEAAPSRRARRGAERTAPQEGPARARSERTGANRAGRAGSRDPGRERPGSCGARTAPRAAGDSSLNPEHNFALAQPRGADPSYFRLWLPRAPWGPLCPGGESPRPRVTVPLPERVRARRQGRGQTEGGGQRNLTPVGVGGQGDYLSPEEVRAARPDAWGRLQQSLLRPHPPRSAPTSRKVRGPAGSRGWGSVSGGGVLSVANQESRGAGCWLRWSPRRTQSRQRTCPLPSALPWELVPDPLPCSTAPSAPQGVGRGVRGHALSLPPPLARSRMQKANEC